MTAPRGDQGLQRIVVAIVLQQEAMVDLARAADKLQENLVAHRTSDLGGGRQNRLGIELFAVEQQAVHVEDDRGRRPGKAHRSSRGLRSARLPARRTPRPSAPS